MPVAGVDIGTMPGIIEILLLNADGAEARLVIDATRPWTGPRLVEIPAPLRFVDPGAVPANFVLVPAGWAWLGGEDRLTGRGAPVPPLDAAVCRVAHDVGVAECRRLPAPAAADHRRVGVRNSRRRRPPLRLGRRPGRYPGSRRDRRPDAVRAYLGRGG
jgi:hypothetical protein